MFRDIQKNFGKVKKISDSQFALSLVSLSLPIIIQNFMSAGLNLVDNIMVGQLGDDAVASVGLANQIYFMFNLFLLGVSGGTSMFIAQFWGKKDITNIRRVLGLGLLLAVVTGILVVIFTTGFPRFIMEILSNDTAVVDLGTEYLRISSISYLFFAVSTIYAVSMRGVGHAKPPMLANLVGIILNTGLNYLLIFGKFGFPVMGITGAAIATCIARLIEMVIILAVVYSHKWPSSARMHELFDLNKKLVYRFFSQSGLLIFKDIIWAVGITIYMMIYARMGTDVIASINIVRVIQQLSMVFFIGIATACQIMLGNLIGAGENDRAQTYGKRFFVITIISSVLTGLALAAGKDYLLVPYNVSEQAAGNAVQMILIFAWYMPLSMTNLVFVVGIMRSSGDTVICIVMDLIAVFAIGMPLLLLGVYTWQFHVVTIFGLVMLQEIFKSVLLVGRFLTKKWIRNVMYNLE